MAYATAADGTRLYYEISGSGEPLFLIAGQGGDHHGWDPVRADFEADHTVIVHDHRGTGLSDKPVRPPYTIRLFAADVIAVLNEVGLARAHVCGHSMGGRICQRLAIDHPDRVGSVVLSATTPGNRQGERRPVAVDTAMRELTDPVQRTEFLLDQMFTPAFAAAEPAQYSEARARFRNQPPPESLRLHYAASEGHEAWEELPAISAPVLVIHGSDDTLNATPNARLLADRIPGAELRIIEGGRHGYHIEFRKESSRAVLDFLRRHPL